MWNPLTMSLRKNCNDVRNKKHGIKTITLFFASSKRTEFYKSSRTIAYHLANTIQTDGGIWRGAWSNIVYSEWEEGILLKRRVLEILNLAERTLEELKGKEEVVEGTITIGCGEFAAVETLAEICKTYKEKYPLVQIVLHTATADAVYEMMNKGLVDITLFLEPVDTEGLDYIRITDSSLKYHLQNAKNHGVTQKERVFPIGAPNDGFAPYFSGRSETLAWCRTGWMVFSSCCER